MPFTSAAASNAATASETNAPRNAAEIAAEASEFEARFNAKLAADPRSRASLEKLQRAAATYGRRWTTVLRRLGIEGEPDYRTVMAAWLSVGLRKEDFGRGDLGGLIEVLEAKANILERISECKGAPTSPLLLKKTGLMGGRQKGTTRAIKVRGDLLLLRRGSMTQEAFASIRLRIKRNTYRRAECDGLATKETILKIADRLGYDPRDLLR